ncbi:FtsX-like permease family protein [Anaerosporobacter sp.]
MTFRDVAIKNFRKNIRNYFAYFLCSSFSIMLFFMYTTMLFNESLADANQIEVLQYVFPITLVAIGAFSIFFISYAHRTFLKWRNMEFGIYMSLGMNEKDIKNLVLVENVLIAGGSMIVGILIGTLLSRLFQMVVLSMMEIDDIKYQLSFTSYLVTIGVYLVIFAIVLVETNIKMKKMNIGNLLKDARKKEGRKYRKKDTVLGILGFIIMVVSIISVAIIASNDKWNSNPVILAVYMIVSFIGLYMALSYGGNYVIHLFKKGKNYYKNLVTITQIHHKFNQNKKIIYILSILSTMTIFLVASPFALLRLSEDIALMNPYSLELIEGKEAYDISGEELRNRFASYDINKSLEIPFLKGEIRVSGEEETLEKPIMSVTDYNQIVEQNIELDEGEVIQYIIDWTPGLHGVVPGEEYEILVGETSVKVIMTDSIRAPWNIVAFGNDGIIVMNDTDYEKFKEVVSSEYQYCYHGLVFEDWKKSGESVLTLKEKLEEKAEYPIKSTITDYDELKNGYSVFLFVTTVLGILFFVASGSVLYFKQFSEIEELKKTFYQMFKIGITQKEISHIISKELLVIFYLPLVFGSYMGVSLIYLMTFIVGGGDIIKQFLQTASVVIGLYFVLQSIFFFITRRKYMVELIR